MLRKHEWQRENEFGSALWMIQHRIESDRFRLVAFCCRCTGSNLNFSIYKNAWRTKPAFYRRETNS